MQYAALVRPIIIMGILCSRDDAGYMDLRVDEVEKDSPMDPKFDSLNIVGRLSFHPANNERVIFSAEVQKINRRGQWQDRWFVVTDGALYNLLPFSYNKCQRRIEIRKVSRVTLNQNRSELVIHVPSQYDYHVHMQQSLCDKFATSLSQSNPDIQVVSSVEGDLTGLTTTRKAATGNTWVQSRARMR